MVQQCVRFIKRNTIFLGALLFLFFYSAGITLATPPTTKYQPGETLDPSCAPGGTNCSVEILPDQTGHSGEFLTTDGTSVSWAAVSVGSFFAQNGNSFGGLATLGTNDTNALAFETDGTERMRILSTGNVGIGDTSPAALFTVGNGDLFQVDSSGIALAPAGSVSAPSFSFTGDPNTGMFRSAADTLAFATGGVKVWEISPVGRLTIGGAGGNPGINVYIGNAGNDTSLLAGGNRNVGIGVSVLPSITSSGSRNVAIGNDAMFASTTAASNVAIGDGPLAANLTGSYNIAIGVSALRFGTAGAENIGIGYSAGSLSTGSDNIFLGFQAGNNLTAGSANIIIGNDIDAPSATGSNQLNIGNLIFGTGIDGTGTTVSTGNIGIGDTSPAALFTVGSGDLFQINSSGIALAPAGSASTPSYSFTGDTDTGMFSSGANALAFAVGGSKVWEVSSTGRLTIKFPLGGPTDFNVFLGNAGNDTSLFFGGNKNVGIGASVLPSITFGGNNNVAIGTDAMFAATTANLNVAIGNGPLAANITGASNIAIGTSALRFGTSGSSNVAVGNFAGYQMGGSNNIFIGELSGGNMTAGLKNIIIGDNIDAPSSTGSNQLSIGNLIFGTGIDGTGTTVSSGNIGIGTNSPDRRFHSELSDSGTNSISYPLRLTHITSGTATTGFGLGQEFEAENASGTNRVVSSFTFPYTDATNATEDTDFVVNLIDAGTLSERFRVSSDGFGTFQSGVIVNELGLDVDTRIEGDTDTNLLFADASADKIGIGDSSPIEKLHIENGNLLINKTGGSGEWKMAFSFNDSEKFGFYANTNGEGKLFAASGGYFTTIYSNGIERLRLGATTEAVFNEDGNNYDFRVEGDTNASLFFVDASTDRVGIGTSTPATKFDITTDSLGTTQSDTSGLAVINTTDAAVGAQQISPAIRWRGEGWKTDATAASQTVDFRSYVLPAQGTSAPTGSWILQSAINGGAYTNQLTVSTLGTVTATGALVSSSGYFSTINNDGVYIGSSSSTTTRLRLNVQTGGNPSIQFQVNGTQVGEMSSDSGRFFFNANGSRKVAFMNDGTENMSVGTAETVVNDGAASYDFRVEGDTNANLFLVDGSADRVGISTASPDRLLHVEIAGSGTNAIEYALRLTNTTSGTATTGYGIGQEFEAENASGTNRVASTFDFPYTDATNATEDTDFVLKLIDAGTLSERFRVTSDGVAQFSSNAVPATSDGAALGTSSLMWSDLFLADGSVINWNNGDITLTHAANNLTVDGGGLVFNEAGGDFDVRAEGDTDANLFFLDASTDKIGMGTNAPATRLHVLKNIAGNYDSQLTLEEDQTDAYAQLSLIGTAREWHFGVGGGSETAFNVPDKFFIWDQQAVAMRFVIETNGEIGIGTVTPADRLDVQGDIRVGTGTTGCVKDADGTTLTGTCSSDERLKTDIEDFPSILDRITQLRPVSYRWNQTAAEVYTYGTEDLQYGVIAQNVQEYFPELVTVDTKGYSQVNFSALPFYLLQAIKELDAKITGLPEADQSFSGVASQFFSEVVQSVEDGVAQLTALVTGKLTVGSPEKRTGITLYDEETGEPYCFSIAGGTQKITDGECGISENTDENDEGDDTPPPDDSLGGDETPEDGGGDTGEGTDDVPSDDTSDDGVIDTEDTGNEDGQPTAGESSADSQTANTEGGGETNSEPAPANNGTPEGSLETGV